MRIAVLASNFISIPPTPTNVPAGYSGAPEMIVHWTVEELVRRGYDVTLFAAGDCRTSAKLESVSEVAVSQMQKKGTEFSLDYELLLASKCYKEAQLGKFDLIHSHLVSRSAFFASFVKTPTVVTIHSPLDGLAGSVLEHYKKDQHYVSISNAQRHPLPDLNYTDTVYHGIDLTGINPNYNRGNYLVFVGRFAPQKGVVDAVGAAKLAGEELILFGTESNDSNYFDIEVKPLIDKVKIQSYGFIERNKLFEMLAGAKALLFPIHWEEPFGLVMIEAMATGTPVIAYNRGSVSEIIADGETGFIIDPISSLSDLNIKETSVDRLVKAIAKINSMSDNETISMRRNCRSHVEKNFTIAKMVDGYEEVYKKVLGSKK